MNSKNIKENTWYKIKNAPSYPHFLAKKLHKPGTVIRSCKSFLVEGIHVSSHTQDDSFGVVRYFRPSNLIETTQPKAKGGAMSDTKKADFSQSNNDLHWSIYDINPKTMIGEMIRWSGYNDNFWWNKISVSDQFQVQSSAITGRTYRLNPETGEVAISEAAKGE